MENASKAIIIAGAIIIALLVISLAIYFYNQSRDVVDIYGNKINATEIKNHNNSFLIYEGELLGTEVINACVKIKEYNVNARLPVSVTVKYDKSTVATFTYKDIGGYQNIINNISKTRLYKGSVTLDNQGVINAVSFEPK